MMPKTHPATAQGIWDKLAGIARREGLRGFGNRFVDWMKGWLWYYGHYMVMYPIEPQQSFPLLETKNWPGAQAQLQVLDPNDVSTLEELIRMYRIPATREGILQRVSAGERCYLCWINEQIAGYVWILLAGPIQEYNQTLFTLQEDEAYIHDAYVVPEWRGRSLYSWMKALASREISAQFGKKKMVSYVRRGNHASLNASRKLGGLRTGHIGCLRVFKRRFWIRIPYRPRPL